MAILRDVMPSIRAFLLADADVATNTGSRVYSGELPETQTDAMTERALVLQPAGGSYPTSYQALAKQRIDLRCYGQTYAGARRVWLAAYGALNFMTRNIPDTTILPELDDPGDAPGAVMLESAKCDGGPVHRRERMTDWPMYWGSFLVTYGLQTEGV